MEIGCAEHTILAFTQRVLSPREVVLDHVTVLSNIILTGVSTSLRVFEQSVFFSCPLFSPQHIQDSIQNWFAPCLCEIIVKKFLKLFEKNSGKLSKFYMNFSRLNLGIYSHRFNCARHSFSEYFSSQIFSALFSPFFRLSFAFFFSVQVWKEKDDET